MADAKQLAATAKALIAACDKSLYTNDYCGLEVSKHDACNVTAGIEALRQALAAFEAQAASAAEPAPVQFACWCADNGLQIFDTHDEAMEYANETLREYRKAASFDGEWSGDVDSMWVGAVHITHKPATTEADEEGGVDYVLKGAAPVAQAEPRKPLTDEQIEVMPVWEHFVGLWPETRREIVEAIEAAHGIKENP